MLLTGPPRKPAPAGAPTQPGVEQPAPPSTAPSAQVVPAPAPAAAPQAAPPPPVVERETPAQTLRLERPLYVATLTTRGAALQGWELRDPRYTTGPHAGNIPVRLVDEGDGAAAALLTPFDELGLGSLAERNFELESNDGSTFAFRHQAGGVVVRKIYSFEPDGYAFTLRLK